MEISRIAFPIGLIAFAAICSLLLFCLVSAVFTVLFHHFHDASSTTHPTPVPPILVHARSASRRKPTISALITRTTMLATGHVHPAVLSSNLSSDTALLPKPSSSGDPARLGSWRATWNRTRMGLLGVTFREFIESSSSSAFGFAALSSSGNVLEKLNGVDDRDVDDLEAGRTGISNTADAYDDMSTPFLSYIRLAPNLFKAMEEDELLHSKNIKHVPLGPLEFIVEEDEEAATK
ncbi:hypothetical protein OF83DRAFT_1287716 [Amylostereum chailletii]|nr:hypothetical protein OF83DRAFT_1287716 [Amylostereum chailletii]